MTATTLPFPNEALADPVAAALPVGATVAHLTIESVLHEGPHTIVYRARDPAAPQVPALALMEYFPRTLALRQPDGSLRARQASDAIALSVGREAFVLEANTLEGVLHPGVVRVIGSLQAHRTVYRAMELIDGPTLERFVHERGDTPPTAGEVAALLDALLDALQALHGAGVLHGQVRPDQILMTADRRPILLGMGSAAAEIAHHAVGPWSAPEQPALSRRDRITSATDIYLAAATAWTFAIGEQPPPLRERLEHPEYWDPAAALARLPDGAGDAPGLKRRLCVALAAALALEPTERPQRVADLRRLLSAGSAPAPFHGSTTPLWVGPMPDRDAQWLGPAAAPALRVPLAPPRHAPPPMPSARAAAAALAAASLDPALAQQAANDDDDLRLRRPAPARSRFGLTLLLPLVAAGAALAWWLQRDQLDLPPAAIDSITERAAVVPVPVPPAASAVIAVPTPATTATGARPTPPSTEPATAATPLPVADPAPAPVAAAAPDTVAPPVTAASAAVAATPVPDAPVATPPPAVAEAEATTVQPAPVPPPAQAQAPATSRAEPTGSAAAPERPATVAPAQTRAESTRRAAASSPTAPRELCSGRSQFSLVYCLQEVCSRPALRYHAQCIELRRNGDIR